MLGQFVSRTKSNVLVDESMQERKSADEFTSEQFDALRSTWGYVG